MDNKNVSQSGLSGMKQRNNKCELANKMFMVVVWHALSFHRKSMLEYYI